MTRPNNGRACRTNFTSQVGATPMAHSQQIVDEIRSFILSADQTQTDAVKQLAAAYAAAGQEAGNRLRRCADYLQRGLRAEAIQLAEVEPNLLDELSILDFAERDQWEVVCATYGLTS